MEKLVYLRQNSLQMPLVRLASVFIINHIGLLNGGHLRWQTFPLIGKTLTHLDCLRIMGTQWKEKQLLFHSDNMAVVNLWKKGTSVHGDLMSIIRKLFYCSACNELTDNVIHIPRIKNPISDALSRFHFHKFRSLAPEADPHPTRVPQAIWESCLGK